MTVLIILRLCYNILHSGTTVLLYSRERCETNLHSISHRCVLCYCFTALMHGPGGAQLTYKSNKQLRLRGKVGFLYRIACTEHPIQAITGGSPGTAGPEMRSTQMASARKATSGPPAAAMAIAHFSILLCGTIVVVSTRQRCATRLHSISNRCLLCYCTNYCTNA